MSPSVTAIAAAVPLAALPTTGSVGASEGRPCRLYEDVPAGHAVFGTNC